MGLPEPVSFGLFRRASSTGSPENRLTPFNSLNISDGDATVNTEKVVRPDQRVEAFPEGNESAKPLIAFNK